MDFHHLSFAALYFTDRLMIYLKGYLMSMVFSAWTGAYGNMPVVKEEIVSKHAIEQKIYLIRGQKVVLDKDLAELYAIETKVLKQAVKRNIKRFPAAFMFVLIKQ